MILVYLFHFFG